MFRNLALTWMFAVTLMMGTVPALPPTLVISTPAAATQFALAAPIAAGVQTGATAVAVQLSTTEMAVVSGAGFFSWLKVFKAVITLIEAVQGLIKAIKTLFRSSSQTTTSSVEGGETLERSEDERHDYASEADYQAGIVTGVTNQATSTWQQTEVWYGDGGCGGGNEWGGGYYQAQQICF